jgi:hypothetical protein
MIYSASPLPVSANIDFEKDNIPNKCSSIMAIPVMNMEQIGFWKEKFT